VASSPSTNTQKLTESGLARLLGVSRQAIHDLVKRGILTKDGAGLIDVSQAEQALMNTVHPSSKTAAALQTKTDRIEPTKEKQPEEVEATSYHVAKTLREAAEAQIARLKLAEMRGEVIRVDAMKTQLATVFSTIRETLLQAPSRLAPMMAAESNAAVIQTLLETEIHKALDGLSQVQENPGKQPGEAA